MPRHSFTLDQATLASLARFTAARSAGRVPPAVLDEVYESLHRLSPADISWADSAIATAAQLWRRAPERTSIISFFQPQADDLDLLERDPALATIFLFHRDGFVREHALSMTSGALKSGFMVAAMAWRLNDWVRPVRLAARLSFERTLALTTADVIMQAAPYLLTHSRTWGRMDIEQAATLEAIFDRPDVLSAISDVLMSGTSGPLAGMLRRMLRGPELDDVLPALAQKAREPNVRATALRTLLDKEARWPEGFGQEWIDKSMGVSRRVMQFGRRHINSESDMDILVRTALKDRSVAVRIIVADFLTRSPNYSELPRAISILARDRRAAVRARADFMIRHGMGGELAP